MNFDLIKWIMNPFMLMFIATVSGLLLGKALKIGTSGALFTGLGMGWAVMRAANGVIASGEGNVKAAKSLLKVNVVDKGFFLLFLILFVAAVGLLAADKIAIIIKKYGAKFIILGFLITFLGASTTYFMTTLGSGGNPYEVSGVYTGALTSSPGLAAALETARDHAVEWSGDYENLSEHDQNRILNIIDPTVKHDASKVASLTPEEVDTFIVNAEAGVGVGHAIGYPFGVLIVILAMRLIPRLFKLNVEEEFEVFRAEMKDAEAASTVKYIEPCTFDLIAFGLACGLGYTLGMVKVYLGPLGYFSLGSTGGVLIASLVLGYIGRIGFLNFRMDKKILGVIRDMGLAFFLAIVGLRYGFAVIDSLSGSGMYLAVVSITVGVVSMLIGFIFGKYVLKINWIMLSGAICGGMTSTPGLGVAIDAVGSDDPAAGYGATYPFALFGMVLFTIILHKLPM
jgi:putative transport protein